jgi:hypothetical protein
LYQGLAGVGRVVDHDHGRRDGNQGRHCLYLSVFLASVHFPSRPRRHASQSSVRCTGTGVPAGRVAPRVARI